MRHSRTIADRLRTVAAASAGMLAVVVVLAVPTAAHASPTCAVTYHKTWDNGRAFGARLTVTNAGEAIDGWTLTFTFAGAQRITTGWPVSWAQVAGDGQVTATADRPWNARLAAGASITIGFNATYTGANADPAAFTLNGTACGPTDPGNGSPKVGNPYLGAEVYVNPEWRANALAEPGGHRVADQPTGVWLDSIAAIHGTPGGGSASAMGLADHLDQALVQAAGKPMVVQLVLYNLPGRNCSRAAYDGDFAPSELARYKAEFIDAIAAIIARPAYAGLRIVTVLEPESLADLVTNAYAWPDPSLLCDTMLANGGYVHGIGYALAKLGARPNVHAYLDVSHHGAVGWAEPFAATADLLWRTANAAGSTPAHVSGFITNTANYSALQEPFVSVNERTRLSRWIDWNQFNDELTFAQALRAELVRTGFPAGVGALIDTSRNGWGGPARPTAPSTSLDLNTFVDGSRMDRRLYKRNYCNQTGAGLGERPRAAPADGVHAYTWMKPPGESDGASTSILDQPFDRMCDPTYGGPPRATSTPSGALPGAPAAGEWFSAQFQQLMRNAHPPL